MNSWIKIKELQASAFNFEKRSKLSVLGVVGCRFRRIEFSRTFTFAWILQAPTMSDHSGKGAYTIHISRRNLRCCLFHRRRRAPPNFWERWIRSPIRGIRGCSYNPVERDKFRMDLMAAIAFHLTFVDQQFVSLDIRLMHQWPRRNTHNRLPLEPDRWHSPDLPW